MWPEFNSKIFNITLICLVTVSGAQTMARCFDPPPDWLHLKTTKWVIFTCKSLNFILMHVSHTIYDMNIQFYAINSLNTLFIFLIKKHVCCFVFAKKQGRLPVWLCAPSRDAGARVIQLPTISKVLSFDTLIEINIAKKVLHTRIKHDTWEDFLVWIS